MGDSRPDVEGTLQVRCTVVSCTRSGTKQHTPLPSPFRVDLVASRQRTRDEFPTLVPRYIVPYGVRSTESNTRAAARSTTWRRRADRSRTAGTGACAIACEGLGLVGGSRDLAARTHSRSCQMSHVSFLILGSVQSNGDARMMLSSALSCTPRPAPPSASLTTRAPLTAPVLPRGRELRGAHPGRGRRSSHASYTLTVDDSPVQR